MEQEKQKLVTFEELTISKTEDIISRIALHTGQAGSIFGPRGDALEDYKNAEDYVKYIKGKVELDAHYAGKIVVDGADGPKEIVKLTGAIVTAYVNSHPDVVQAKKDEAKAAMDLDNARALANTYLDVKEHLKTLQSARLNEFHSDPTIKTSENKPGGFHN